MMHSSPMPLNIALDMTKRLQHELAKHMTPEQQRDFQRIERLIKEAQKQSLANMLKPNNAAVRKAPPEAAPQKRRLWGR